MRFYQRPVQKRPVLTKREACRAVLMNRLNPIVRRK